MPFGLRVLSGGRYAVVHLDGSIVKNTTVVGQVFMTVVPSARSSRCIDVPVPTHDPTVIPRLALRTDTLFVLDQFERNDSLVVEIKKYPHRSGRVLRLSCERLSRNTNGRLKWSVRLRFDEIPVAESHRNNANASGPLRVLRSRPLSHKHLRSG